jgi:hypothetical protein
MQVFTVVNNNTAYVVTFGAEQAEYDKNIQDVEKLLNSIKINRNAMENVQENQNQPANSANNTPTVLIDRKYYTGT